MNIIDSFFGSQFFIVVGDITTIITIFGLLYTIYLAVRGVLPILYRLGMALSKRKVAIFANGEYESLKSMLVDSKIFKERNILQINKNDLRKAEKENLFLVHWNEHQNNIYEILKIKKDTTVLIVYAPQNEGRIDQVTLDKINNERNTIVVNLRGRLLNDTLVSLMTTSYKNNSYV